MGWRLHNLDKPEPCGGYRHFRLVLQGGKGRERWVELEAVLDAHTRQRVAWRELCDSTLWSSGWQQIPVEEPDDDQLEGSAMNNEAEPEPPG